YCVIGTVVTNHEHVESCDPTLFGETDFHPSLKARTATSDEGLLLAADAHHHRRVRFLGQQGRDEHRDPAGDLATEPACGVFADENNFFRIDVQPSCDRGQRLRGALSARVNVDL